jgi:RNA polymerase subunit RPABC4/transcription elongation factor Spt4
MDAPEKQIPPERKAIYYGGVALTGIGILMFLSTFVTFIANFGNFDNFQGQAQSGFFRAFTGMALMVFGFFAMSVGARGWAGSHVVLDPEKARKDMEPWSRMSGGILQDALTEVEIVKMIEGRLDSPEPLVKVRCLKCQSLNDETAKFCNQCGSAI